MSVTDLSYARKRPGDRPRTLAIETRGWGCGWAVFEGDRPVDCGRASARDHVEGKPVPQSHRVAGLFRNLLQIAGEREVGFVVSEVKVRPGPVWMLPPLLAVAIECRFAELRDWQTQLGLDAKSLRSWATVILGKPPEDELMTFALGMAAVASKLFRSEASPVLATPGSSLEE